MNDVIEWPDNWEATVGSDFDDSIQGATYVDVRSGSDEWKAVEAEWRGKATEPLAVKTNNPIMFTNKLLRVQRVQNPMAWTAYYNRVRQLASRSRRPRRANETVFIRANEWIMKHGTRGTSPAVICESRCGLNFQYSDGGFFGRAAYTAEDASYSHGYRYHYPDGSAQMLLVRVAAGVVYEVQQRTAAHEKLREPPQGFDSVRGYVTGREKAIMVYQTDSAYPAYLITYQL